jgi:hypothetical protein
VGPRCGGDFDKLDQFVSRQTGVQWIGTDPGEWWEGAQAVCDAWRTEATEMGGPVRITGGSATAYQHGDVA